MSQSHVRIPKAPPSWKPQWPFWVGTPLIVGLIGFLSFWGAFRNSGPSGTHSTAQGRISETRVVVDHIFDGSRGGRIFYRLEAHVSFLAEGTSQDRWLVVPQDITDRDWLMVKEATNPKSCQVYWTPGYPDDAKCKIW